MSQGIGPTTRGVASDPPPSAHPATSWTPLPLSQWGALILGLKGTGGK